ncbi:MAG: Abi family protein [bacterium]|nr:Abi family protein [bacterium]
MEFFNKDALTAEEQIDLLIKRGLQVADINSAVKTIKRIGYYHLSSYMRFFQCDNKHNFIDNIEFAQIVNLYNFDKELRHITFKAIEQIEIAYRAAISNIMCKQFGSHWFYNDELYISNLIKVNSDEEEFITQQQQVLNTIQSEIKKKKKNNKYAETFIKKYYEKYSEPQLPPFWMAAETFTIGSLHRIYYSLKDCYKKQITEYLGFSSDATFIALFSNWLQPICMVRNICAHHSRLFNRIFKIKAKQHNQIAEFKGISNNRFYYISMIINYYLQTMCYDSSFETDIINLFNRYPSINKEKLGFPNDWEHFSITRLKKHENKIVPNVAR